MSMIGHNSASKGGYIIITREMLDHPVVGAAQPMKPADTKKNAFSKFEAWVDLLRQAAYKPRKVLNKGREMILDRGQIMCANTYLAKRWNWTTKAVRNFLDRLQEWEMVGNEWHYKNKKSPKYRGNQNKVLTICNYSIYQGDGNTKGQPRGNQMGNQRGNQGATVSDCKQKEKDDSCSGGGHPKGQPKGQQYNNQYNQYKKDNINIIQKDKKSDLQIALDEYNQLADRTELPQAKVLNKDRTKKLTARLDEHGLEGWRQALEMIEGSSFLCGEATDWKASIDFLLQPSSFVKVLEGTYGNGRARKPKPDPKRDEELAKIRAELKQMARENTECVIK